MRKEETSFTLCSLYNAGERGSSAFILSISGIQDKAYLQTPEYALLVVVLCPLCLLEAVEQRLVRNGGYARWIPVGCSYQRGWIFRKYCRRCDVSFSLIPDFILRRQRYGRWLIVSWLWACLCGATSRSLAFLRQQGIRHAEPDGFTCWSDLLDSDRTCPGYQLLWHWFTVFSRRAQQRIPRLVEACLSLQCDFKRDVVACLQSLPYVPRRGRALAVAVGLWRAVMQANDSDGTLVLLEDALFSLVGHLASESLPASHKLRRASGGRVLYDTLAVGGRPPPQTMHLGGE